MTFGIESSNIVGYTAKDAPQGKFLILGAQFEGVAGGSKINDLVSGVVGVDWDEANVFRDTAAQIQVPVSGGYDVYYYLNDGWYDDGSANGAYKAGWCDGDGSIVDVELTPGVAVWFKSVPGDAVATFAGAVPESDEATVTCPASFALRANIFPVSVALNGAGMVSSDIVGVDWDEGNAFRDTASQIQVPVTGGYDVYYYLNDGWYDDGSTDGAYKAGWCDGDGSIVDAVIPAAQGFWTKGTSGSFSLKFTK